MGFAEAEYETRHIYLVETTPVRTFVLAGYSVFNTLFSVEEEKTRQPQLRGEGAWGSR